MAMQNANELRRLVEGADGIRGRDLTYAVQGERLEPVDSRTQPGNFIKVFTDFHGDGMRGAVNLLLSRGNIPPTADAAFTTQSAFEKFVLPYYVRTRSIKELNQMAESFYKSGVLCAYHDPSSEIITVEGDIFLLHESGVSEPLNLAQPNQPPRPRAG